MKVRAAYLAHSMTDSFMGIEYSATAAISPGLSAFGLIKYPNILHFYSTCLDLPGPLIANHDYPGGRRHVLRYGKCGRNCAVGE